MYVKRFSTNNKEKMLMQVSQSSLTAVAVTNNVVRRKSISFLKKCSFSSQKTIHNKITPRSIVASFPSIAQPVPNLRKSFYATAKEEYRVTKVTVLLNALKIASEISFDQFCRVVETVFAVLLDSGPRYEIAYPRGISHFLQKLAFGSTKTYKSKNTR